MKRLIGLMLAVVTLPLGALLAADAAIPIWEPITIGPGQEGEYVVVRDFGSGGTSCKVNLTNVTGSVDIDLNGFTLHGDSICANNVGILSVRNGTLRGHDTGLRCFNCGTVVVSDVQFEDHEAGGGLLLSHVKQFAIRRNTFRRLSGILVEDASAGLIEGNVLQEDAMLVVANSSSVEVRHNNVNGASYNVVVNGNACVIAENTLSGGGSLGTNSCDGCLFADNTVQAGGGISLANLRNSTVRGNTVSGTQAGSGIGSAIGIHLDSGGGNFVLDNVVGQSAEVGLLIASSGNHLERNILSNNTGFGLRIIGSQNVYRGNTARGNGGTGCTNPLATADFCDEGTNNTSHGDNYMPGQM